MRHAGVTPAAGAGRSWATFDRTGHWATDAAEAAGDRLRVLRNLESLDLSETQLYDRGLGYLKGATNLRTLNLGGTQVTDDGLKKLGGLKKLESLNPCGTWVTVRGSSTLRG